MPSGGVLLVLLPYRGMGRGEQHLSRTLHCEKMKALRTGGVLIREVALLLKEGALK